MKELQLNLCDSLEKIRLHQAPNPCVTPRFEAMRGEEVSFQIAYLMTGDENKAEFRISITSPVEQYITLYAVGHVACELPAYKNQHDEYYLSIEPGLFPDPLLPLTNATISAVCGQYRSIWVSVDLPEDAKAGCAPISIAFTSVDDVVSYTFDVELRVLDACLPKQEILYTQWLHSDCIATYYGLEVFSEAYWDMLAKFIQTAAKNGINMMLTPIFTPPLDTAVGAERPTVQLVEISEEHGVYSFDFVHLKRWVSLCRTCGITHFEMSHLFTQWGAQACPKIIVNGTSKFGWDTASNSVEYITFLDQFLPKLLTFLKENELINVAFFHLSDEPSLAQIPTYREVSAIVRRHLRNMPVMDAISDYDFYKEGLIDHPVVAIDHIAKFLEHDTPHLWAYYCCAQNRKVSNRFIAQPSARSRAIALPLYKFGIEGFLHWGYNFYYTQYSKALIDPFRVTDAGCAFPSGDAFSVYPGQAGPIESIRLKVFRETLQDLRALKMLERFMPPEKVIALIEEGIPPITFDEYPHDAQFYQSLRHRVNTKILEFIK